MGRRATPGPGGQGSYSLVIALTGQSTSYHDRSFLRRAVLHTDRDVTQVAIIG